MKKNYLILSICTSLILLSMGACNEETMEISSPANIEEPTLKSSYDEPSISNPTLHSDWENVKEIYLNDGRVIDAPWIIKELNSMNIPDNYMTDIKKQDGWKLLAHTMIKINLAEPDYILLYNEKRGLLKGFYFNPDAVLNNSFLWYMESRNGKSKIIPSNAGTQESFDHESQAITTSNIVKASNFNYGHLNKGWNMFQFEFIYSPTNNNPMISISGYNNVQGTIGLNGTYTGEVVIPQTVSGNSLTDIKNVSDILTGAAGGIFGLFKKDTISSIISLAGTIFGSSTAYTSTSDVTYITARSSGNIELTGSSQTPGSGIVMSTDDFFVKRINDGKDVGLWTLSQNIKYKYNKWQEITVLASENSLGGTIACYPVQDIKSLIVINPVVRNEIESYRIVDTKFFTKTASGFESVKASDNRYLTSLEFSITADWQRYYAQNPDKDVIFVTTFQRVPADLYVNVTVEFTYKDGTKYMSSRNFKPEAYLNDNASDYYDLQRDPFVKIVFF
jgi:hypothetical protein